MSRPLAALGALAALCAGAALAAWLLLPTLLRELVELTRTLPGAVGRLAAWADGARAWAESRLPGIALPEMDLAGLQGVLAGIAGGTIHLAVNLADLAGRVSMMVVLAYFFLCDRDRLLLRLELLLPQSCRHMAVRMGIAVCGELCITRRAGQGTVGKWTGCLCCKQAYRSFFRNRGKNEFTIYREQRGSRSRPGDGRVFRFSRKRPS